jgi:hypothetical protein
MPVRALMSQSSSRTTTKYREIILLKSPTILFTARKDKVLERLVKEALQLINRLNPSSESIAEGSERNTTLHSILKD